MESVMNVSISVNDRFTAYAYVMLKSLFENHKNIDVNVYVLYNDLAKYSIENLQMLGNKYGQKVFEVFIDPEWFPNDLPHNDGWTMEIYYRLALPDVLPLKVKRVLYLDVDIIVLDSLWEFYNVNFGGKSLCACPDMSALDGLLDEQRNLFMDIVDKPDFQYFNSGVLLMNLEKIRKNYNLRNFITKLLELPVVSPDQDLLNYLFYGDVILKDEERFNLFAKKAYQAGHGYDWVKEHTALIHFTGIKPWSYEALHYETEKFWWEYAKETPYYVKFLEDVVLNQVETSFMDRLVRQMVEEKNELLDLVKQKLIEMRGGGIP